MNTIRRAAILKLASMAYEMDLDVLKGIVRRDASGRWQVGEQDVHQWLAQHEQEDIVLVLGSLADERPVEVRTCRTCGRDYTEMDCPHCRANRIRLRGRA
ncbi:MAG: hypothetical protein KA314_18250 [Chloroflexi bacterium]|nr:hypothetical protein [Chloroflexota bacterium]MBP8057773.1 hypothetical protein [Chloroflexota bacterium]